MSRCHVAIAVATVVGVVVAPANAVAHSVTWCAYSPVQYVDSDVDQPQFPEDHWEETDVTTNKSIRGARYELWQDSTGLKVSNGFLFDGINGAAGCTGALSLSSGTYDFFVYSEGEVQGNTLDVGDTHGNTKFVLAYDVSVSASGTKNFYSAPVSETDDVFNVYQAAAWALYRHAGGMSNETYYIQVGNPTECTPNGSSCSDAPSDSSFIADGAIRKKFLIVHELGHVLGYHAEPNLRNALNYAFPENLEIEINDVCQPPPGANPSTSHVFHELEWVGAALGEGFADFYAADVWNDHNETDCWFAAWANPPALSCEAGTPNYPHSWVDDLTCTDPDFPDTGERIDFMRILWDLHTDPASPQVTFTYLLQTWLAAAGTWEKDDAFLVIDARADYLGGAFDDNWVDAVEWNAQYLCPPTGLCR